MQIIVGERSSKPQLLIKIKITLAHLMKTHHTCEDMVFANKHDHNVKLKYELRSRFKE